MWLAQLTLKLKFPSKRAFEKCKSRGLFSECYGIFKKSFFAIDFMHVHYAYNSNFHNITKAEQYTTTCMFFNFSCKWRWNLGTLADAKSWTDIGLYKIEKGKYSISYRCEQKEIFSA